VGLKSVLIHDFAQLSLGESEPQRILKMNHRTLRLKSHAGGLPMRKKTRGILGLAIVWVSLGASSANPPAADIPFPSGFRDWFVVNSMIVTKDSPIFGQIGGLHIIYVNAKGLATLKKGGPLPYPDGTVLADDVHEFSVKNGSYVEGEKKAVTVMLKDAKKYATNGGWGFQAWAGGDPSKPLVPDATHATQACFLCHTPQRANDYTFSRYIP
jgi:hypothetical protein